MQLSVENKALSPKALPAAVLTLLITLADFIGSLRYTRVAIFLAEKRTAGRCRVSFLVFGNGSTRKLRNRNYRSKTVN